MKIYSIILIVCLTLFASASRIRAQESVTFNNATYVKLSVDSLWPVTLKFADSLHGYYAGYKVTQDPITFWITSTLYWYRTSDGGRSWLPMNVGLDFGKDVIYSGMPVIARTYASCRYSPSICIQSPSVAFINKSQYDYTTQGTPPIKGIDSGLYITTDAGMSWQRTSVLHVSDTYEILGTTPSYVIGYNKSGRFLNRSFNYGKTFFPIQFDNVLKHSLYPFPDSSTNSTADIIFDNSDENNMAAIVRYNAVNLLSLDSSSILSGLTILVSSDGGQSWKERPYDYNSIFHPISYWYRYTTANPQFVKGTKDLYLFSGGVNEGTAIRTALPGFYRASLDNSDGYSFLYSSDLGESWSINSSYWYRRRAYEAIGKSEVYETISTSDTLRYEDYADRLIHTTDNGNSWDIDSTILNVADFLHFDGRILTASDPSHLWCCAVSGNQTWIIRYTPQEQNRGIAESANQGKKYQFFKIYPNPASEKTIFQILTSQQITDIELGDLMGRKVEAPYKLLSKNKAEIDLHSLSPGIYFANVRYFDHGVGIYSNKFLIY